MQALESIMAKKGAMQNLSNIAHYAIRKKKTNLRLLSLFLIFIPFTFEIVSFYCQIICLILSSFISKENLLV